MLTLCEETCNKLHVRTSVKPFVLQQSVTLEAYVIRTDTSTYAIVAMLTEGERENERPIEYASLLLRQAERNYSNIEYEV